VPAFPGVAENSFTARQGVRAAGDDGCMPTPPSSARCSGRVHHPSLDRTLISMTDNPSSAAEDPADENENVRLLLAHFHQTEQARLEGAKSRLRAEIIPRLAQHRVTNVEVAYSGYGDSGAIDGVQFRDPAGQRVERTSLPGDVIEQLENCLYEFLPAGFEINDGSQGTLTLDTHTAKVTIQHQENYTETRDSSQEFTL
jgi:hypothetical protein